MTLQEFAKTVVDDPAYRESLLKRARAGTLGEELEVLLISMSEGRMPLSADRADTPPAQSRTLALVRPSDFKDVADE